MHIFKQQDGVRHSSKLRTEQTMDSGDEYDISSTLEFKKMYDDQLPKHDSAKNPEGTQKWLNACDDVVQSMTQAGGDKLVAMQRKKMPEIGPAVKKSIGHAPPWLKADSELNYRWHVAIFRVKIPDSVVHAWKWFGAQLEFSSPQPR